MRDPSALTPAQTKNINRDEAGVIVTVREQSSGDLRTAHHHGLNRQALKDACAWIDELDGDWRIISISTPRTIAEDVKSRVRLDRLGRQIPLTEQLLLGKVGRLDLLEPHKVTAEHGQLSNQRGRVRKPAA